MRAARFGRHTVQVQMEVSSKEIRASHWPNSFFLSCKGVVYNPGTTLLSLYTTAAKSWSLVTNSIMEPYRSQPVLSYINSFFYFFRNKWLHSDIEKACDGSIPNHWPLSGAALSKSRGGVPSFAPLQLRLYLITLDGHGPSSCAVASSG